MPQPSHLATGDYGENLAVQALCQAGYTILARRYRTAAGEIDIVALDGRCLVFVEVKTRRQARCGAPAEAVTANKQRRIVAMARDYLARHRVDAVACRFDVVSVSLVERPPAVEIIRNAFDAG